VHALYDYTALTTGESELSFKAGEKWFFVASLPGGWICVENMETGQMGHVPEGYVELLAPTAPNDVAVVNGRDTVRTGR
jgi:hypothetical protein